MFYQCFQHQERCALAISIGTYNLEGTEEVYTYVSKYSDRKLPLLLELTAQKPYRRAHAGYIGGGLPIYVKCVCVCANTDMYVYMYMHMSVYTYITMHIYTYIYFYVYFLFIRTQIRYHHHGLEYRAWLRINR